MVCPVCEKFVRGDVDVVEAHVDSCLAHARISEAQDRGSGSRHGDEEMDVDVDGDGEGVEKGIRESVTTGVSFRGALFLSNIHVYNGLTDVIMGRDRLRHTRSQSARH